MRTQSEEKGIVLLVVLATILVVVVLAQVILNTIVNQSRLTLHQISRIQAYYAAMAGVNYAYEKLRNREDANWPLPSTLANKYYTRRICRGEAGCGCTVCDPSFPSSIRYIDLTITDRNATSPPAPKRCYPPGAFYNIPICIDVSVDYAYQ
jgi:type II secretory pathway pseudopilin PulG